MNPNQDNQGYGSEPGRVSKPFYLAPKEVSHALSAS